MTADDWISGEEEVSIRTAPYPRFQAERPSCEIDLKRVRFGFLIAFCRLHKNGDFTPDELAEIFGISRPTVYRTIKDLNKRLRDALGDFCRINDDD